MELIFDQNDYFIIKVFYFLSNNLFTVLLKLFLKHLKISTA